MTNKIDCTESIAEDTGALTSTSTMNTIGNQRQLTFPLLLFGVVGLLGESTKRAGDIEKK